MGAWVLKPNAQVQLICYWCCNEKLILNSRKVLYIIVFDIISNFIIIEDE